MSHSHSYSSTHHLTHYQNRPLRNELLTHRPIRGLPTHCYKHSDCHSPISSLWFTTYPSIHKRPPAHPPGNTSTQYTQQICNPLIQQRLAHAFIDDPTFLRTGHTRLFTLTYPLFLWHSTPPFTRAHTQGEGVQKVPGFIPLYTNEETQIL
jgi:hypothetical protein